MRPPSSAICAGCAALAAVWQLQQGFKANLPHLAGVDRSRVRRGLEGAGVLAAAGVFGAPGVFGGRPGPCKSKKRLVSFLEVL